MNKYVCREGDTLLRIAAMTYGDIMAFEELAEINKISLCTAPEPLMPGREILLPPTIKRINPARQKWFLENRRLLCLN